MQPTKKYTVITGASSGIGYETAKAFASRGKNLIVAARRTENLERLKHEVLERHPALDIVIRTVDLSALEGVYPPESFSCPLPPLQHQHIPHFGGNSYYFFQDFYSLFCGAIFEYIPAWTRREYGGCKSRGKADPRLDPRG